MNATPDIRNPAKSWLGFKSLVAVLLLGVTGLIAGCGGGGGASAPAAPTLASISVAGASSTLVAGLTDQYTATGVYSDGSKKDLTSSVTWTSSDTTAATISTAGLVTGVAAGATTITAMSAGVSGTADLTVTAATLVSIGVTAATTLSMVTGQKEQFTATGVYTDNSKQNLTSKVAWTSGTTTVATVGAATGSVDAVGVGSSVITATLGTVSGAASVTVAAPVLKSIAVTPATPSVANGLTQQFTATGTYQNGLTQDLTSTVTWTSGTTTVATIGAGGLASTIAPGSSLITATMGSVSGSTTLKVTAAVLVSIQITPSPASVAKGSTLQFTATGTYSNGTMANVTATAIWASTAPAYATISNSPGTEGLATAIAQGSLAITAKLNGVTGSASLTVNPAALVSIAVTPATPSVIQGGTVQFTATGTYTDSSHQNLTTTATWTSNNTAVATISNASGSNGLATGVLAGTSGITATVGSIVSSPVITLTVKHPEYAYVTNYGSNTVSQYTVSPNTGALVAMSPATVAAGTQPYAIAIDTTNKFAYVANFGSANVSQYTIGATGALTANSIAATVATGNGPNGVTITATNVYVANYTDGTVSQYGINANGTLTPLTPATVTAGAGTASVTIDPAGTYALVANYSAGSVMVFSIGVGGALSTTPVSTTSLGVGHLPDSIAIDAAGTHVYVGDRYVNDVAQYSFSAGALSALSPATVTVGGNPYFVDLASTVAGTFLYVCNAANANNTVQQLTPGTGGVLALTSTTSVGTGTNPSFIAIDASGRYAYVSDRGAGTVSQYSIDTVGTAGALAPLSPATAAAGTQPTGIAMTPVY